MLTLPERITEHTWDWVLQSVRTNPDKAVIVRLEPDGNLSFLHGDPTKELERKLADCIQDCETLARFEAFEEAAERIEEACMTSVRSSDLRLLAHTIRALKDKS